MFVSCGMSEGNFNMIFFAVAVPLGVMLKNSVNIYFIIYTGSNNCASSHVQWEINIARPTVSDGKH